MKNCILCNKPHLERRSEFRKVKIKSIEVEYEYFWDYCPELDLEFESEELIDENLNRVRREYNKIKGDK